LGKWWNSNWWWVIIVGVIVVVLLVTVLNPGLWMALAMGRKRSGG
jgi:hypothetical protein